MPADSHDYPTRTSLDPVLVRRGIAWVALALALALHVADEALTGFLPRYNALVRSLRESMSWFPFPTFSFPVWLGGLCLLVAVLLAMTPLVLRGVGWIRYICYFLGIVMIVNAIGHIAASLLIRDFAPGVYSSPLLLLAAVALLLTTLRAGKDAI